MTTKQTQKGFTIIEVVLVLAIAALIFLIVFLAVPALQRSQRDTQRRSDVGRLQAAASNYAGNHQATIPTVAQMTDTSASGFVSKFMTSTGDKFEDPLKGAYTMTAGVATTTPSASVTFSSDGGKIWYLAGGRCNTDGTLASGASTTRAFAITTVLESNDLYCTQN